MVINQKVMSSDSFNISEVMKKIEHERLKRRIISNISHDIILLINSITKSTDCKIIKSDISKLNGSKVFNGIMKIVVSVTDKGANKELSIPILVNHSLPKLPDRNIVIQKLADIKTEDIIQKKTQAFTANHINKIDKDQAQMKLASEKAQADRKFERDKKAKTVEIPTGGFSGVPSKDMADQITYNKSSLPGLELNDEIKFGGHTYKVTGEAPNAFGQPDSKEWVLTLIKEAK